MSVKGDILESLRTAFTSITKNNGYSLDVAKVFVGSQSISMATEYCPAIIIVEGNEIKLAENEENVMFLAELAITALLKSPETNISLTYDINNFSADIKRIIYGNPSLGEHKLALRILGIDNGTLENFEHAYSSISAQLIYYAQKGIF